MNEEIKNVKYNLIESIDPKLVEVLVTFTLNGEVRRHYIFLKKTSNGNARTYLKQAEAQFKNDVETGKIDSFRREVRKQKKRKKSLIVFACIATLLALGAGGAVAYKYLYSDSTEEGGGGGGGDEKYTASINIQEEAKKDGYTISLSKTEVELNKAFSATITLNIPEKKVTKLWKLPKMLGPKSVKVNDKYLGAKEFTYEKTDKNKAAFNIDDASKVTGNIEITVTLQQDAIGIPVHLQGDIDYISIDKDFATPYELFDPTLTVEVDNIEIDTETFSVKLGTESIQYELVPTLVDSHYEYNLRIDGTLIVEGQGDLYIFAELEEPPVPTKEIEINMEGDYSLHNCKLCDAHKHELENGSKIQLYNGQTEYVFQVKPNDKDYYVAELYIGLFKTIEWMSTEYSPEMPVGGDCYAENERKDSDGFIPLTVKCEDLNEVDIVRIYSISTTPLDADTNITATIECPSGFELSLFNEQITTGNTIRPLTVSQSYMTYKYNFPFVIKIPNDNEYYLTKENIAIYFNSIKAEFYDYDLIKINSNEYILNINVDTDFSEDLTSIKIKIDGAETLPPSYVLLNDSGEGIKFENGSSIYNLEGSSGKELTLPIKYTGDNLNYAVAVTSGATPVSSSITDLGDGSGEIYLEFEEEISEYSNIEIEIIYTYAPYITLDAYAANYVKLYDAGPSEYLYSMPIRDFKTEEGRFSFEFAPLDGVSVDNLSLSIKGFGYKFSSIEETTEGRYKAICSGLKDGWKLHDMILHVEPRQWDAVTVTFDTITDCVITPQDPSHPDPISSGPVTLTPNEEGVLKFDCEVSGDEPEKLTFKDDVSFILSEQSIGDGVTCEFEPEAFDDYSHGVLSIYLPNHDLEALEMTTATAVEKVMVPIMTSTSTTADVCSVKFVRGDTEIDLSETATSINYESPSMARFRIKATKSSQIVTACNALFNGSTTTRMQLIEPNDWRLNIPSEEEITSIVINPTVLDKKETLVTYEFESSIVKSITTQEGDVITSSGDGVIPCPGYSLFLKTEQLPDDYELNCDVLDKDGKEVGSAIFSEQKYKTGYDYVIKITEIESEATDVRLVFYIEQIPEL